MNQLPEELLSRICFFLRPHPDRAHESHYDASCRPTLLSICLASRTCFRAARPHLYHTIHLEFYRNHSVQSLLRSLAKPENARLVRHVSTNTWRTPSEAQNHPRSPGPSASEEVLEAVEGLAVSDSLKQSLRAGLQVSAEDAQHAVVLCLCTRLVSWQTDGGYDVSNTLVFDLVREAAGAPVGAGVPLQQLRSADLQHWDTEGCTHIETLVDVLALPSLETFKGYMLACDGPNPEPFPTSAIRHVHLDFTLVDGPGLAQLWIACPRLETFEVRWGLESYQATAIGYTEIGEALRQHGAALKTLKFSLDELNEEEICDAEEGVLGDLSSLVALRHLQVPFSAFFGRDESLVGEASYLRHRLPTGLEALKIGCTGDWPEFNRFEPDGDVLQGARANLLELMLDSRFASLREIAAHRWLPCTDGLRAEGWEEAGSTDYWRTVRSASPSA